MVCHFFQEKIHAQQKATLFMGDGPSFFEKRGLKKIRPLFNFLNFTWCLCTITFTKARLSGVWQLDEVVSLTTPCVCMCLKRRLALCATIMTWNTSPTFFAWSIFIFLYHLAEPITTTRCPSKKGSCLDRDTQSTKDSISTELYFAIPESLGTYAPLIPSLAVYLAHQQAHSQSYLWTKRSLFQTNTF